MPDNGLDPRQRLAMAVGGGLLVSLGVAKRGVAGGAMAAGGGVLIWQAIRGVTIRSLTKMPSSQGPMRLNRTITISNKAPEEVYEAWRDLENLPKLIAGLESVTVTGDGRSHWAAKGLAGKSVEWDSEITNDRRGHVIEWRSLPGSDTNMSGIVRFKRKRGHGTKVHLSLQFTSPGGAVGETLMNWFGVRPEQRVDAGLEGFREALERA